MSVRAAFLSAALLLATSFVGLAIHAEGAMAARATADGYGVSADFSR